MTSGFIFLARLIQIHWNCNELGVKGQFFLEPAVVGMWAQFINFSLLVNIWLSCLEIVIENKKYQYSIWTIGYIIQ